MDHYGQHSMNSVNSSMNNLSVSGGMPSYPSNLYYRPMGNETSSQDDFFPEFVKTTTTHTVTTSTPEPPAQQANSLNIVPAQPQQAPYDAEVLSHLRTGMTRMLATLERLEQRITRVEQVTSTILKNQQEVFQVPFMSQKDIDTARQLAEQLEQDTSVAKQLQAAYNKEIEVRKNQAHPMAMADCPICGARVSQGDLEVHVDQCLEMFSNDPKKQVEVKETKQKVEQGFFSRMFNKTKTETTTTTTKAITSRSNSSTNLPETDKNASSLYPAYGYHPNFMPGMMSPQQMQQMQQMQSMQNMQGNMPMMMPMYMYGGYPNMNQGE